MKLFWWTLTRTPPPREIVRPRASQEAETPSGVHDRLNQLETVVERLQLDNQERQLAVLTAVEKVMHQLRAREAKRARENQGDGDPLQPGGDGDRHVFQPDRSLHPDQMTSSSAHLASRFRRY